MSAGGRSAGRNERTTMQSQSKMTAADLAPILDAFRGAISLGLRSPVVLALVEGSDRANAVHQALEGRPMPPLPPSADPADPRLLFQVHPRDLVAEVLRRVCGTAGTMLAGELEAEGFRRDGWVVVVRPDGLGWLGISGGQPVVEGSRSFEASVPAPAGAAPVAPKPSCRNRGRRRPGRRGR